jgi:hypothetical protein
VMLGLSPIVTILTQIASSLFSRRGPTLLTGLTVLFKQRGPRSNPIIAANAKLLAQMVLNHPLASDSLFASTTSQPPATGVSLVGRWRLANTISPSHLVLKNIADNPPPFLKPGLGAMLGAEINAALAKPRFLALRQASTLATTAVGVPKAMTPSLVEVTSTVSGNPDSSFDKILDRVGQRFTMWTRLSFIACAAALMCIQGCGEKRAGTASTPAQYPCNAYSHTGGEGASSADGHNGQPGTAGGA